MLTRRHDAIADEDHQTCIQGLYGKLHRAKDVAQELFQKKTALLDEWKLRVEEKERLEEIEDLCQIVPHEDEPPCSERGHRGPGGRLPRLCSTHREEYVRRTTEYEATFEEAKRLYALVSSDVIECGLADLDKAMETAGRCIGTLQMEMHQWEDYLRRFFLERMFSLSALFAWNHEC